MDGVGEGFGGHFVEVGDGDTSGEDGAVGVLGGEGGGGLGCEFVEFDGGDAGIHALDDFLGDEYGVYELSWCVVENEWERGTLRLGAMDSKVDETSHY